METSKLIDAARVLGTNRKLEPFTNCGAGVYEGRFMHIELVTNPDLTSRIITPTPQSRLAQLACTKCIG